ncbi:MAG: ABC transporter permease [Planctomycetes bacterium]|nr:ABC transporter permease [Planctomycetota bacterium]
MSDLDRSRGRFWRSHEFALLGAVLAVLVLTTILDKNHNYYVQWQLSTIDLSRQTALLALYALGAAVVIIVGGIDLSTGSVVAFSGTICATLMLLMAPEAVEHSQPIGSVVISAAIVGTLLVGILIGSLHAWLITEVGLPPFVATLGTLVGLRSLSRAIIESVTQAVSGGTKTQINIADKQFRELSGAISGTAWNLVFLVVVVGFLLWVLLSKTVTGRHLYALGGNEQAARLSGIQTDRLKWLAYCISAVLSSLVGILYVSQLSVADPQTAGRGYELNAIAAAVVGGCSLQGGVGTIPGTLFGALFLRVVIDGVAKIIKTGADVYEGLIVGVLVVFAVTFTKSSGTASAPRRLFAGPLGWVTVLNLTLLAGVMMALLGAKLIEGRTQMDPTWQAFLAAASTLSLLLIIRAAWARTTKKWAGIAWSAVVIVTAIGCDQAYPGVQRHSAMKAVQALGGRIVLGDQGIVVDLNGTSCDDATFKRILPRLKYFPNLVELRLRETRISDAGLDAIRSTWDTTRPLLRLDTTGSQSTPGGRVRMQRWKEDLEIVP